MKNLVHPYLEQQYNNRQAVPDFADYLQDWKTRSEDFRALSQGFLNIAYGASEREVFDIFPAENPDAPLHIFIHGGYWQALDKDSFSFMAEAFNQRGEAGIIFNYDLCPNVGLDKITQQIQDAILALHSDTMPCPLNTDKIQISGHSAGGHLVAEMLTQNWKSLGLKKTPFQRVTSLSGLFELTPLTLTSVNLALQLNGNQAALHSPIRKRANVESGVELNLIVGEIESHCYIEQSKNLVREWAESGLRINFELAEKQHHFSILQHFLDNSYRALD